MPTQDFIFVVLPNGVTSHKTLSLSVHLSPRLSAGATLAQFPDMLKWAALIQKSGLEFELSCNAKTLKVPVNRAVLRPDIWKQLFTPTTYVDPPKFPDFDKRLIVSYPVRDSLSYLKYAYQSVATNNLPSQEGQRGLYTLLEPLMFRDGKESTIDNAISKTRIALYQQQRNSLFPELGNPPGVAVMEATVGTPPPDGVPTSTQPPVNTRDTMTRFAMYHHMPPAPGRPPLPKNEAGFAKTLDFHRAITALSSYPTLLRYLGLVFDIEVPESFCPASPTGGSYETIGVKTISAGFKWKIAQRFCTPRTSYLRDAKNFYTAPATDPASFAQGKYTPGDVVDGLLALSPADFHLLQVDLDGALLKALSMADNVAFVDYRDGDFSKVGDALPALRSSGIGLVADGRGMQLLQAIAENKSFDNAFTSNSPLPRPLNVRDVVRGYRIDILSSRSKQWRSLHRRNATYKFGATDAVVVSKQDEEGFLQPVAASPAEDPTRPTDPAATAAGVPQPGTDLYIHERIVRWDGWSLSAQRPGKALNRSADPSKATEDDPTTGQPMTPFKMETSFEATPGSLPQLRFGDQYRLRARAVDLAGNSIALNTEPTEALTVPPPKTAFTYMRFDPVPAPLVVLQQKPGAGASHEHVVIRSYNSDPSLDSVVTSEVDNRHIAPPRTSVRMAEQHGELDNAMSHLRGDPSIYGLLIERDAFEFPIVGKDSPIESGSSLKVEYLSDPVARGAAFRDLPNASNNTNGRIQGSALKYATLPDVQPRAGSVTYIDFGTGWPDRKALRMQLVEGTSAPKWDSAARVLTVSLQKAGTASVDLSSYINPADLDIMGVWGWMREMFEAQELQAMSIPWANTSVNMTSDAIALITRLVLEGGHELITPARTLNLTHAVQQPIGFPEFVQLPVVHQPSMPIFASALRNYFTPITAWRSVGSHSAVLLGGLHIHGASSVRIDVQARWHEFTDDVSLPAPTTAVHSHHVEKIELADTNAVPIYSDVSAARMVAVYIPKVDTLWFAAAFDELEGVTTPGDVAAPVHRFDDTKHRWVSYYPVATSRFQENFADQALDFTRSGAPLVVDVPSSARPLAPDIAYVVPAFGWEKQESSNAKSVIRFGNTLRVYLKRPWYTSGDDELLGVVLWPSNVADPDYAARETYKPYFTQWGNDPIWKTDAVSNVPNYNEFPGALTTANGLALEETTTQTFDVAGHQVAFDKDRGLWYCDILFRSSTSYCPFVRLALARYQTHSIQGVELSRVVLADYAQLAADRSAVVTIDTGNPQNARIFIGGVGPQGPVPTIIEVSVERRLPKVQTDLGWEPAPATEVTVSEDTPAPSQPGAILWSGGVHFTKTPPPGQYRIVVREYEQIAVESKLTILLEPAYGLRLVYASIIPYNYFPLGKK